MYSLVALVSSLAVASASICCIPPQWEGQVGFLTGLNRNGKGESVSGGALMAYDGVRHLIGQRETISMSDGRKIQVDVLLDYDHDTKYIRQGSQCIKTKLNRVWEDGCVPDNATAIGLNTNFGLGSNKVPINSYSINFGGAVTAYVSVTSNGCIPVLETWRGMLENVYFLQNTAYVNISAGLSRPEDLNVPPVSCENAPMVEAHYTEGMFNTGMVGKRSIFGF